MCIQLFLVSVLLLAFVSPFSSSREFSGFTPQQGTVINIWKHCIVVHYYRNVATNSHSMGKTLNFRLLRCMSYGTVER